MPVFCIVVFLALVAGIVIALRELAAAAASIWAGVVATAMHIVTVIGIVICVLGALAAAVAVIYVIGTFLERIHRSHLYARHQREQLAMEWDQRMYDRRELRDRGRYHLTGPEGFDR